ncbi:hypothetical protein EU555_31365 [Methylobacterium nonmethylotrophicum]|uniref:Apple domain-containing protein n=1 Tax=Methylobacterium nonmethylotrophicum TaxID=1141884 RepID=A0A4Z0NEQ0_9HYPH|nr:hypothetical protein EU555_31365 [Methylobacterium nonmethylotrophicum]
MPSRALLALVPVSLLLAVPAAEAQGNPFFDPEATGSLRDGRAAGEPVPRTGPQVCQRWCEADHVPCDPPNFKIADGRCRPFGGSRF